MQAGHWAKERIADRAAVTLLSGFILSSLLCAAGNASDKAKPSGQTVDSGAFGVFIGGQRVATETFSIQQSTAGSSISSEFKADGATEKAVQSSQLELGANGDLEKYEWKETSPGEAQAVVQPSESFLMERFRKTPQDKPQEQPFMLPASTSILDDYFFVQREVLAWRYLATSCKQDKGQIQCPMKQSAQMGTLNAHSRQSMLVNVQFSGREKTPVHGVERELIRLDLKSDAGDWTLWLDDQLKLQRIQIPSENTEVVRD